MYLMTHAKFSSVRDFQIMIMILEGWANRDFSRSLSWSKTMACNSGLLRILSQMSKDLATKVFVIGSDCSEVLK